MHMEIQTIANVYNVSFRDDGNVLELDFGDDCITL